MGDNDNIIRTIDCGICNWLRDVGLLEIFLPYVQFVVDIVLLWYYRLLEHIALIIGFFTVFPVKIKEFLDIFLEISLDNIFYDIIRMGLEISDIFFLFGMLFAAVGAVIHDFIVLFISCYVIYLILKTPLDLAEKNKMHELRSIICVLYLWFGLLFLFIFFCLYPMLKF